jgi:peptidoglycan/LPS O-acetylase OafA/YrhL
MQKHSATTEHHGRYEVLDGMRGIAAITVMLYHYSKHLDHPIFGGAGTAVDLFFILSGFVISYSYGARLQSGMGYFEYVMKRVIRIYPMFIMGVIIGVPVLYLLARAGVATAPMRSIAGSLFYNSVFMPDFNNFQVRNMGANDGTLGEVFPTDPPAWSLFFEMVASFAFPFLYNLKQKSLIGIIIVSFSGYVIFSLVNALLNYQNWFNLDGGWGVTNFLNGFPRVFFGFSFGILLHSFADDKRLVKLRNVGRRFITHPYIVYLLLIVIFAIPKMVKGMYPAFVIAVAAPLLVYIGSMLPCRGYINVKLARFLGWISFPLYCLHFPIGLGVFFFAAKDGYSKDLAAIVSVGLTFLVSIVATKLYEEPVRKYFSKKLSGAVRQPVQIVSLDPIV